MDNHDDHDDHDDRDVKTFELTSNLINTIQNYISGKPHVKTGLQALIQDNHDVKSISYQLDMLKRNHEQQKINNRMLEMENKHLQEQIRLLKTRQPMTVNNITNNTVNNNLIIMPQKRLMEDLLRMFNEQISHYNGSPVQLADLETNVGAVEEITSDKLKDKMDLISTDIYNVAKKKNNGFPEQIKNEINGEMMRYLHHFTNNNV